MNTGIQSQNTGDRDREKQQIIGQRKDIAIKYIQALSRGDTTTMEQMLAPGLIGSGSKNPFPGQRLEVKKCFHGDDDDSLFVLIEAGAKTSVHGTLIFGDNNLIKDLEFTTEV